MVRWPRREPDLAIALLVAVVAASAVHGPVWLRVLPGVLLAAVLPGYALAVALFPERRFEPFARAMLIVALSLVATAATGLVVDRLTELRAESWGITLAALTAAAVLVAARRRHTLTARHEGLVRRWPGIPVRPLGLAAAVIGVVMTAGAVLIARLPAGSGSVQGYSALWATHGQGRAGGFVTGVRSSELRSSTYRLRAVSGRQVVLDRRFSLRPGSERRFSARVQLAQDGLPTDLTILLYRGDAAAGPAYRRVTLSFDASPTAT